MIFISRIRVFSMVDKNYLISEIVARKMTNRGSALRGVFGDPDRETVIRPNSKLILFLGKLGSLNTIWGLNLFFDQVSKSYCHICVKNSGQKSIFLLKVCERFGIFFCIHFFACIFQNDPEMLGIMRSEKKVEIFWVKILVSKFCHFCQK